MRLPFEASLFVILALGLEGPGKAQDLRPKDYKGAAFQDANHRGQAQTIPGRVRCAYYDRGGEGVAFHDADAKNSGSGHLNPLDGKYLNEFRKAEGVDTSYTKFWDQIDDNPYNLVAPEEGQLYVGWTEPGEWIRMTVQVQHAGEYTVSLMYTSNRGGTIGLELNGRPLAAPLALVSTASEKEPLAWRQWHHWNRMDQLAKVKLPKGLSVLTLKVLSEGNMNFDYLEFVKAF